MLLKHGGLLSLDNLGVQQITPTGQPFAFMEAKTLLEPDQGLHHFTDISLGNLCVGK